MSFSQLIDDHFLERGREIMQGMAGTIEKFDKAKMRADVKPLLKYKNTLGEETDYPVLVDLPVLHYYGGGFYVRPVYEKGDLVWISFSTFDTDNAFRGYARAESGKLFSLENACVVSGIAKTNWIAPVKYQSEDGLILGHKDGNAVIKLESGQVTIDLGVNGKVAIGNQTGELIDLIMQLFQQIQTSTCPPGAPLSNAGSMVAIMQIINNFLKGSL